MKRFFLWLVVLTLGCPVVWGQTNEAKSTDALAELKAKGAAGDLASQYALGDIYREAGAAEKALEWYRKAADQGYDRAQHRVAVAYQVGVGVPKDSKEAVEWFRKAAAQGHGRSCFQLASHYERGVGVRRNWVEAHKWFIVSHACGYSLAGRLVKEMEKRNFRENEMLAERQAREFLATLGK